MTQINLILINPINIDTKDALTTNSNPLVQEISTSQTFRSSTALTTTQLLKYFRSSSNSIVSRNFDSSTNSAFTRIIRVVYVILTNFLISLIHLILLRLLHLLLFYRLSEHASYREVVRDPHWHNAMAEELTDSNIRFSFIVTKNTYCWLLSSL